MEDRTPKAAQELAPTLKPSDDPVAETDPLTLWPSLVPSKMGVTVPVPNVQVCWNEKGAKFETPCALVTLTSKTSVTAAAAGPANADTAIAAMQDTQRIGSSIVNAGAFRPRDDPAFGSASGVMRGL